MQQLRAAFVVAVDADEVTAAYKVPNRAGAQQHHWYDEQAMTEVLPRRPLVEVGDTPEEDEQCTNNDPRIGRKNKLDYLHPNPRISVARRLAQTNRPFASGSRS